MKMRPVLAIAILGTAAAAVLFRGSLAQEVKQDHHTERISGARRVFFSLCYFLRAFLLA
jgi:ABC-type dipeptide/oligopeptide/nickel transport system permease component